MKRNDKLIVRTIVALCVPMLFQADAQTNNVSSTNQIEQTKTESIEVQVGDSLESVLKVLGEPRVDCPLNDGKRIYIYEEGEIQFQDNKVTSVSMLTAEQLAEKREQQRLKQQRATAAELILAPPKDQNRTSSTDREDQLRNEASELRREISFSRKMASGYMSSAISCYNLMVGFDGKKGVQFKKDLLACIPNNSIEEFYSVDLNFDYFERRYQHISSARLNLNSLCREYALFIEEYEKLLEYDAALSAILKELDKLESNRDQRPGP